MGNEFWKNSPFKEDSIFHPSWEEKQKERKLKNYKGVKIIQMDAVPNYPLLGINPVALPFPLSNPKNYIISSDSKYVTVAVKVIVQLNAGAEKVEISLNKNTSITASRSITSNFQYVANFNVKVGRFFARIDQYNSQEFIFTAKVRDVFTKEISDTMSVKTQIDTKGRVNDITEFKSKTPCGCICNNTSLSKENLICIVTQLRKKDILHKAYLPVKDDSGKVIRYEDHTLYNDNIPGGKIEAKLFFIEYKEYLQKSDRNYNSLTKYLNIAFKKYNINTCVRKLHFLALSYQETLRFRTTYELNPRNTVSGGDFYRGRGFLQLTHDYNYKEYYKFVFGTSPTKKQLNEFVPMVATKLKYAIDSAGWYWQKKEINKYADMDDFAKSSAALNYPALLNESNFNPNRIVGWTSRKKFYSLLKEILDIEHCND